MIVDGGPRIFECIVYDRALTEDERMTLNVYLCKKYDITISREIECFMAEKAIKAMFKRIDKQNAVLNRVLEVAGFMLLGNVYLATAIGIIGLISHAFGHNLCYIGR